jgi:hypothetical protein
MMKGADLVVESLLRGLLTALPRLPEEGDDQLDMGTPHRIGERSEARRRSRGRAHGRGR